MENKPTILLAGKGLPAFYLEDQNSAQSHMATFTPPHTSTMKSHKRY